MLPPVSRLPHLNTVSWLSQRQGAPVKSRSLSTAWPWSSVFSQRSRTATPIRIIHHRNLHRRIAGVRYAHQSERHERNNNVQSASGEKPEAFVPRKVFDAE
ncbi:hypothetical protein [Cedecea colo]|uniref:Uncharacterized protein n=1 Tax=Cedecea colo TaxID=2552946 RepID=A0ABX0VKQ9_9ENTR|nr:hypothetical protein [Cedecea colo]NIY47513.1 hypothetical protein [Cedecea colo]